MFFLGGKVYFSFLLYIYSVFSPMEKYSVSHFNSKRVKYNVFKKKIKIKIKIFINPERRKKNIAKDM